MKKSIITLTVVILLAAIMLFGVFFGLNLGFIRVPAAEDGIKLGLDLVGGSEITYEAVMNEDSEVSMEEAIDSAITMLRQRLNALGYTEANVYTSGTNRIVLEVPNVSDPEEAVQMLGTTAIIEFRDADGNVILNGKDIVSASAAYGPVTESGIYSYYVSLKLTDEGRLKFKEGTKTAANRTNEEDRYVAIVMDDEIISQPGVDKAEYGTTGIDTDSPVIYLGDTASLESAKYLAEIISAGQLPITLVESKLQAVGASLGERSLETAIIAGIIGCLLVMIYMILMYRLPGIICDIALLLYIAVFVVVMSAFGINLSLPGIAGIVLTIGMAVDANVIIYERMKEELRAGKTVRSAVDSSFKSAFSSILDANVTTVIAALVLLWKGTGTILGFAKTLLIGVILSMLCLLVVSRVLLKSISQVRTFNKLSYFGVVKEKPSFAEKHMGGFSFVGHGKLITLISALLVATGLIGLVLLPFKVTLFNFDIDFVGGVTMEIDIGRAVDRDITEEIENIVADATGENASSVSKSGSTGVVIKMMEISTVERDALFDAVAEKYGENVTLVSSDFVSASVGNDIKKAAFIASTLAAALILLYITFRFEFRSGLAAIICLLHDVLVMLGIYIIFRIPMNMNCIAAMLTIIGYSINATIVIFDRIRGEVKRYGGSADFGEIVDKSIWLTMGRSISTTITSLLPIIAILILGVTSVRNFAIPLFAGMISGAYSSVCVAGPLWNKLKGKKNIKA